jgi:UDP-N-acetylmuramate dehydrogenase
MEVRYNYCLISRNSYQLPATCAKAFFPKSNSDFLEFFNGRNRPFVLLGSGHNVILSKAEYEEDFIIVDENFSQIEIEEDSQVIVAEAGCRMTKLSEVAAGLDYTGLEIFYDIPSTVGGAVVMNAGASGEEIKDILLKVEYLDLKDGKVKEILKENINFEYRNGLFQKDKTLIVLRSWFLLNVGEAHLIREKMNKVKEARWNKQPRNLPNAGSVFKRPRGYYVGAIIEDLGLKGYSVGGAKISEKHGGFIVNTGDAKGADVLAIIRHVKHEVFEKYNIELEIEQRII